MGTKVILKNVRLSFPRLWEARQFKEGEGKPRYDANFLMETGGEMHKAVRKACIAEAKAGWGPKAEKFIKSIEGNTQKFCFTDGDLKEADGHEGHWVLASHRNQDQGPPSVVGRTRDKSTGRLVKLTAADGKPYSGCFVNATVEIWAQKGTNSGIRCTLLGVQFFKDGDAFAGAPASDEDFDVLDDDEEEEDDDDFGEFDGDDEDEDDDEPPF